MINLGLPRGGVLTRGPSAFDNSAASAGVGNLTVAWGGGVPPRDGALILVLAFCMSQFFGTPAQILPPAGFTLLDVASSSVSPPQTTAQTFFRIANAEPLSYFWGMRGFGEGTGVCMMAYDLTNLHEHGLTCDSFLAPPWAIPSIVTAQPNYTLVGMWGFAGDQNTSGSGSLGVLPSTNRARATVALADVGGSDKAATGSPTPSTYSAPGPASTTELIARATFVLTN